MGGQRNNKNADRKKGIEYQHPSLRPVRESIRNPLILFIVIIYDLFASLNFIYHLDQNKVNDGSAESKEIRDVVLLFFLYSGGLQCIL